jgi:hypothetical protein
MTRADLRTSLAQDERGGGVLATEYLILLVFVGLMVVLGFIIVGFPLLHQYRFMQLVLASPAV